MRRPCEQQTSLRLNRRITRQTAHLPCGSFTVRCAQHKPGKHAATGPRTDVIYFVTFSAIRSDELLLSQVGKPQPSCHSPKPPTKSELCPQVLSILTVSTSLPMP